MTAAPKSWPDVAGCADCGAPGCFALRQGVGDTETRTWYCSAHVPEEFGLPPSVAKLFEQELLATQENPPALAAPRAPVNPF